MPAVFATLLVPGCRRAEQAATPSELSLMDPGRHGPFLEGLPGLAAAGGEKEERTLSRPVALAGFASEYHRVEALVGSKRRKILGATFWGGEPRPGATFTYRCGPASTGSLRWWMFSGPGSAASARVALTFGRRSVTAQPPEQPGRVVLYESALPPGLCDGRPRTLTLAAQQVPSGVLMSLPVAVVPGRAAAPVVLISVDTLRRDYWEDHASRESAWKGWRERFIRFSRAHSSYPSTPISHSVLFSGLWPADLRSAPADEQISFTSALRARNYTTLGFVAGGYMRANFGFNGRGAGFATGFDLYVEDYQRTPRERRELSHLTVEGQEKVLALETHTLASGLDRSLRWFERFAHEPAFHFIHGYDVHEYRSVARRYWDAAVARRLAAGLEPAALARCRRSSPMTVAGDTVAHYPFEPGIERRGLREPEECQRLLFSLFYEARVHSAADMLDRYFRALQRLGVFDRALIVLTSDHGESLRDEVDAAGRAVWGHNRVLANNLRIPLWIKPPGGQAAPEAADALAGLVDVRATLRKALDLPTDPRHGTDLLAPGPRDERAIRFASNRDGSGVVLPDATLCAWSRQSAADVRLHDGRAWRRAADCSGGRAGEACPALQRCARLAERLAAASSVAAPSIPADLNEELRALGYID